MVYIVRPNFSTQLVGKIWYVSLIRNRIINMWQPRSDVSIAKTTKGSSTRFTHEGPYQCIAYGEKELQVVSPSPFTRGPIYGGGGRPVKLHCYPRGLACSGGSSVHCQVGSVAYAGVDTRRDLTVWLPGRSKVGSLIYCVSSRLVLGPVRG